MIYILEGTHGGGKSTYAKALFEQGYEVKKCIFNSFHEIVEEITLALESGKNIVYDRICLQYWKKKRDNDFIELNNYLQSVANSVQCLKFVGDIEKAVARMKEHYNQASVNKEDALIYAEATKEKAYYERVFALMPVFIEP